VKVLLAHPRIDVAIEANGMTVADWAIASDDPEAVKLVLAHPRVGRSGRNLGQLAIARGNPDIVRALFEIGELRGSARDPSGSTLLHYACEFESVAALGVILELGGCDVNAQDSDGRTPLHCAVGNGFIDIVRILVDVPGINLSVEDGEKVRYSLKVHHCAGQSTGISPKSQSCSGQGEQPLPRPCTFPHILTLSKSCLLSAVGNGLPGAIHSQWIQPRKLAEKVITVVAIRYYNDFAD
jgi:ankyrin repeat protein